MNNNEEKDKKIKESVEDAARKYLTKRLENMGNSHLWQSEEVERRAFIAGVKWAESNKK
jgi:hypothetical protein